MNELLGENETIINPYYMRQLLQYGMKMGEAHGGSMDSEALQKEAEVGIFSIVFVLGLITTAPIASRGRAPLCSQAIHDDSRNITFKFFGHSLIPNFLLKYEHLSSKLQFGIADTFKTFGSPLIGFHPSK